MTQAEDAKTGVLTVDVDYVKAGQAARNAIHMLQMFLDKLEIAAIEKGMRERERRNGDRRIVDEVNEERRTKKGVNNEEYI